MGKSFPYLILIPLCLSAFVHIWNPAGYPDIHGDEGHYIRRAINIMGGVGAEEPEVPEPNRSYGNPFFGQIFLSSLLVSTNYPDSLHLDEEVTPNSVESLFFVPRILMGILAVVDTFIVYKIAERRYNTTVALAASILFAIVPLSWIIRRVFLESLQLPLILSSVLFAVYYHKHSKSVKSMTNDTNNRLDINQIISISISGIFLGLAIFTKAPVFNLIPLVAFLIYTSNRHIGLKALGVWIIPVLLIPFIWPTYAILEGDTQKWIEGISWQTSREGIGIFSLDQLFKVDPLLLVLGISASIYALVIKKDFFCILWIIPFLVFFSVIGLVRTHNYIPLLPVFCIAGGILIADLCQLFRKNKKPIHQLMVTGLIIGAIGSFGLLNSILHVSNNVNSTYFEIYSFVASELPAFSEDAKNDNISNKVTVIGRNWVISSYSWIPNNLYGNDHEFRTLNSNDKIETQNALLVIDGRMRNTLNDDTEQGKIFAERQAHVMSLYNTTDTIAKFNITNDTIFKDTARGVIEIKSNY